MNSIDMRKPVLFLVYFLLLFFTVSCSDPAKKQNRTEESLKKEINNLLEAEDIANPKELLNKAKELKKRAAEIHYDLGVLGCNLIIMNKLSSF
jgi:lipoprotein NlpI